MSGNRVPPVRSVLGENLSGVLDIMLGRQSGLSRVDLSGSGFWISFAGLAMAGLIDASSLSILHDQSSDRVAATQGKGLYIVGHMVIALISYAASLVALYLLCRAPAEQARVTTAIIVHNWASPIVSLAFLPLLLIAQLLGGSTAENPNAFLNLMSVFWIGLLVFVGLRLMRISLDVSVGRAAWYFAMTTAVSIICSQGLEQMLGLKMPS